MDHAGIAQPGGSRAAAPATVVVTGASSGIGAATALEFARRGHQVVAAARRVGRLEALAEEAQGLSGSIHPIALDVTEDHGVTAFAERAETILGQVDIVVSNVGHISAAAGSDDTPSDFFDQINVNLLSAQRLAHAFVPAMARRRSGDIVFVSSDTAHLARPFASSYTTAKWGLEGFVQALQMELEGTRVRASVVRPGATASEAGSDWAVDAGTTALNAWIRFGIARHPHALPASAIADAIVYVATAPPSTHIRAIDVSPVALDAYA